MSIKIDFELFFVFCHMIGHTHISHKITVFVLNFQKNQVVSQQREYLERSISIGIMPSFSSKMKAAFQNYFRKTENASRWNISWSLPKYTRYLHLCKTNWQQLCQNNTLQVHLPPSIYKLFTQFPTKHYNTLFLPDYLIKKCIKHSLYHIHISYKKIFISPILAQVGYVEYLEYAQ